MHPSLALDLLFCTIRVPQRFGNVDHRIDQAVGAPLRPKVHPSLCVPQERHNAAEWQHVRPEHRPFHPAKVREPCKTTTGRTNVPMDQRTNGPMHTHSKRVRQQDKDKALQLARRRTGSTSPSIIFYFPSYGEPSSGCNGCHCTLPPPSTLSSHAGRKEWGGFSLHSPSMTKPLCIVAPTCITTHGLQNAMTSPEERTSVSHPAACTIGMQCHERVTLMLNHTRRYKHQSRAQHQSCAHAARRTTAQ